MPQVRQNWCRILWRLKVYSVSASAPRSSVKLAAGVKASTEPRRWQREQLQVTGSEMSTVASKATAPHWQEPVWRSAVIPALP